MAIDSFAEPVVRGGFRLVLWLIRLLFEVLLQYVFDAVWELSKRRSWVGWIPALVPAAAGAILAGLALSDGQLWVGVIFLAVGCIPAAGRAVHGVVVSARSRRKLISHRFRA
jgi:hypothetical protein